MKRVYVSFSGGGAKGIVHVGGLKALQEALADVPGEGGKAYLDVQGYSGTSAGAIVAALAAVGYTADEIIDPANKRTVIDLIRDHEKAISPGGITGWRAKTPVDLLGRGGALTLKALRIAKPTVLAAIAIAFSVTLATLARWLDAGWYTWFAFSGLAAFVGVVLWSAKGLLSLDALRDELDRALALKVRPSEPWRQSEPVTFADLDKAKGKGVKPLKVVASDIVNRRLKLFSAETTSTHSVAEAVVASACFPLLFQPRALDGIRMVDGGLVSNLPAWTFEEERALDRDAFVIAFDIESDKPVKSWWFDPLRPLVGIAGTAIFGSGMLNTRGISGLEAISLTTTRRLLDFDMSFEVAKEEIERAHKKTKNQLYSRFDTLPWLFAQAAEQLWAFAKGPEIGLPGTVRIALARPDAGTSRSLRLQNEFGFDGYPDKGLVLPIAGSIVGEAFGKGELIIQEKGTDDAFSEDYALAAPEYEGIRAMLWRDLRWVMCVPIFEDETEEPAEDVEPKVIAVVTIDGDQELPMDEATNQRLLVLSEYAESLYEYVVGELPRHLGSIETRLGSRTEKDD